MKKFLVTGGCGFIGSHLVDALSASGHGVRILDDLSTGTLEYKPQHVELLRGDVANPKMVVDAMAGMDGCFHLAAVASVERGNLDWNGSHRTNLSGTIAIFDAARETKKRPPIPVVYASSAAVYGNSSDLLSEDQRPRPMSAYGADKYGCELHGSVASHVHAVPNCGFRFFNVYGPRQDPHSPYSGVITIFANRLSVDQPLTINGDGYHSRDFIYVGDVVRGLLAGMDHCAATRTASDVFNICTGVETSIIDLAEALGEVFNRTPKIIYGPLRLGDLRRSVGCPLKARRVLDLCAETSLASGLAQTFSPGALNNRRRTRAA